MVVESVVGLVVDLVADSAVVLAVDSGVVLVADSDCMSHRALTVSALAVGSVVE